MAAWPSAQQGPLWVSMSCILPGREVPRHWEPAARSRSGSCHLWTSLKTLSTRWNFSRLSSPCFYSHLWRHWASWDLEHLWYHVRWGASRNPTVASSALSWRPNSNKENLEWISTDYRTSCTVQYCRSYSPFSPWRSFLYVRHYQMAQTTFCRSLSSFDRCILTESSKFLTLCGPSRSWLLLRDWNNLTFWSSCLPHHPYICNHSFCGQWRPVCMSQIFLHQSINGRMCRWNAVFRPQAR